MPDKPDLLDELARLTQLKEPGGDGNSQQQQAGAWHALWRELEAAGILSFVASDGRGRTRAVEFIRHMASELARATLENERLKHDSTEAHDVMDAACENEKRRMRLERDEAVGLLRLVDDLLNYMVPSDAPSGKFRNVREQLRAFLSRLEQPQEKSK